MVKKPFLLAISGKKGVGKTTSAYYLYRKYGFCMAAFADKLKYLAQGLFPFDDPHLNGNLKEEKFNAYEWTPREFMIKFGAFMRYWDEKYWIKSISQLNLKFPTALHDIRYLNEAEYLKSLGFKIIRLNRYENLNPYKLKINDASENELDSYSFDYVIPEVNNQSLYDLYTALDVMLIKLGYEQNT